MLAIVKVADCVVVNGVSDGEIEDDPYTPSSFWKHRAPLPPREAKTSLPASDIKYLPNFIISGPFTSFEWSIFQ
jgi:hypothetical protein